jgi:hypothetical protein
VEKISRGRGLSMDGLRQSMILKGKVPIRRIRIDE